MSRRKKEDRTTEAPVFIRARGRIFDDAVDKYSHSSITEKERRDCLKEINLRTRRVIEDSKIISRQAEKEAVRRSKEKALEEKGRRGPTRLVRAEHAFVELVWDRIRRGFGV